MLEQYGMQIRNLTSFLTVRHSITQHRIELEVFQAQFAGSLPSKLNGMDHRWIQPSELEDYPFASAARRILGRLRENGVKPLRE
jgi:adenine-specific DNA glycosylase